MKVNNLSVIIGHAVYVRPSAEGEGLAQVQLLVHAQLIYYVL